MKLLSFAVLFSVAALAAAHMGLSPTTAEPGSRQVLSLTIAHDCGDDTVGTTNFTVALPTDPPLLSVTAEQTAIWRTFFHTITLDPPVVSGSRTYNETVSAITWVGFLPDHFYRTFNIRAKLPDAENVTLWFKGFQDCHNQGTSIAWATIPNETNPNPRYPARGLKLMRAM